MSDAGHAFNGLIDQLNFASGNRDEWRALCRCDYQTAAGTLAQVFAVLATHISDEMAAGLAAARSEVERLTRERNALSARYEARRRTTLRLIRRR